MDFKVPDNKKIPELEADVLAFWKKNNIFEKSVDQRTSDNTFVFYDGPPFISGLPHYGHLTASMVKDLVSRYQTMRGKKVERVWGWDAHGLTVENYVQKQLGIKDRKDIEAYGLEKFTEACYKYTSKTSAEWNWYIDRIGRWVDMDNAYKTIDQTYMESVMWAFKQLYEKGHIYEGVRTSLFCTTCGTPVSDFEIAMDNTYKEVEDPAVTVKFLLNSGAYKGIFALAWTTTPWTLPSNRGLVIDKNATYVVVDSGGEKYILAEKRSSEVFKGKEHVIIDTFTGADLVGASYEPLYDFFISNDNDFKIYAFDNMVNVADGTGIVHSAPGFGEIDTQMGESSGLTTMLTIDDEGKFIAGTSGVNPFDKMFYKKADRYILEDLTNRTLIFNLSTIMHRFPYHDRCNTLLIQKSQSSWFINVQDLKTELIAQNQAITWVPAHLKHGQFEKTLEQAPDWAISRNRFWATPMPVWESEDGDRIVIGSVEELEALSGMKVKDLHRPYIDEIIFTKDGKEYKRREEVLDSWFEAGSMPYAQYHYPFENKKKFDDNFPGDFIVEYIAQTRAWFQRMHILNVALFNKNSFKTALGYGVLAGNDGRKMSKTYGNYDDPKELLTQLGGDAMRLYFLNSPLMAGKSMNISTEDMRVKSRSVLGPLWNSLNYFLIYAEKYDWKVENIEKSDDILDVWIKVRLHQVIAGFEDHLESYDISPAVQLLEDFVDDLSRWYVRRARDRVSMGDNKALSTLYTVLLEFSKCSASVIPFMAESLYQCLTDEFESVHLCDFPEYSDDFVKRNLDLMAGMEATREVVNQALAIRSSRGIKVRQPLATLRAFGVNPVFEELIKDEVNVKEVIITPGDDFKVELDTEITKELEIEGGAREMVRTFQNLRKEAGLSVNDAIIATYKESEEASLVIRTFEAEVKEKILAEELKPGTEFNVEKS